MVNYSEKEVDLIMKKVKSNSLLLIVHIFLIFFLMFLILLISLEYSWFYIILALYVYTSFKGFRTVLSISGIELRVLTAFGVRRIAISEVKSVKFYKGHGYSGDKHHQIEILINKYKKPLNFNWGSRYLLADLLNVFPDKSVIHKKSFKEIGITLKDGGFVRG
jgi:hypothetical protein